jgi:hypothetical protein
MLTLFLRFNLNININNAYIWLTVLVLALTLTSSAYIISDLYNNLNCYIVSYVNNKW